MRRWPLVVAVLYGLILLAVLWPLGQAAYGWSLGGLVKPKPGATGLVADLLGVPGFWIWLGVMGLSQWALLAVPARLAAGRPVTRGALWPTVLAAALMLAVLVATIFLMLDVVLIPEGKGAPPEDMGLLDWRHRGFAWVMGGWTLLLWAFWAWVFFRTTRNGVDAGWVASVSRYLLAGSILELLVAVPAHVWVRRRDECCADLGTFWGLAMGISVMLFSYGPGVLFLLVARARRKRGKAG